MKKHPYLELSTLEDFIFTNETVVILDSNILSGFEDKKTYHQRSKAKKKTQQDLLNLLTLIDLPEYHIILPDISISMALALLQRSKPSMKRLFHDWENKIMHNEGINYSRYLIGSKKFSTYEKNMPVNWRRVADAIPHPTYQEICISLKYASRRANVYCALGMKDEAYSLIEDGIENAVQAIGEFI